MENKWREQLIQFLLSGLTGGLVGMMIVWIYLPRRDHFEELEVDSLIVRQKFTVRADGNDGDALLVKDGSLFVKNRVVATQFLGAQIAGGVMVSNRQLTTPDDLFGTPADQWRFYTELGGSADDGGEILVRSRNGANSIGKSLDDGVMIRVGFDATEASQMVAHNYRTNVAQTLMSPRARRANEGGTPGIHPAETATQIAAQFFPTNATNPANTTNTPNTDNSALPNDFAPPPLAEKTSASSRAPSHVNARVRTPETTTKEPSDSLPLLNSTPLSPLNPVTPLALISPSESLPPLPILESIPASESLPQLPSLAPMSTAPSFSPLR